MTTRTTGGGGGGGGDSRMKGTGILVVSLRGVNFGFWSRLGCSGQNVISFSRQGLVRVARGEMGRHAALVRSHMSG